MTSTNEDQERYLFAESLFGMSIEASLAGIRDRIISEGSLASLTPRQIQMLDNARMRFSNLERHS